MSQQMHRRSQYVHKGHKCPNDGSVNESGLGALNPRLKERRSDSQKLGSMSRAELLASAEWALNAADSSNTRLKNGVTKKSGKR